MGNEQGGAEPMELHVDDALLADLHDRLARSRFPDDLDNDDWIYGTNLVYLREFVGYWRGQYDWRVHEAAINSLLNFRANIDGVPIHFVHAPSPHSDAVPIVLTHGWPWTFWDYRRLIGPLTDPLRYGGGQGDAFHVVIPSLPGYAFSSPVPRVGFNPWSTAALWHVLMRNVLGYERYGAHGADWGNMVSGELGHRFADSVIGVHLVRPTYLGSFSGDRPWTTQLLVPKQDVSDELYQRVIRWERGVAAHVATHVLGPQSIAYGGTDSPVGMAGWILERYRNWSDCHGDLESRFSRDDLITTMMLFWVTNTFASSMRFYADAARFPWQPAHDRTPVIEAPTGITIFAPDLPLGEATQVNEADFNLCFQRTRGSGGHFPATEEPDALVEDIRETFRSLR